MADEWDSQIRVLHLHSNIQVPPKERLDADDFSKLNTTLSRLMRGDVLMAYSHHRMRAVRAFRLDGDYSEAVMYSHTALEVFVDAVLYLLLWEEGADPAQAAMDVPSSLGSRVTASLAGRLGGQWSMRGRGAIAEWWTVLRPLRNRVVHRAYDASPAEAQKALEIMLRVDVFLRGRLAERAPRFPRTSLLVLGIPGLRRHERWSKRLSAIVENSVDEADWVKTALAWRAAFDAARLNGI
jgi:hypothetical protein